MKNWDAPLVMPSSISDSGELSFLNETGHIEMDRLWDNPKRSKLWLYNVHYFDDLNAKNADSRIELAQSLIQKWVDENPPLQGNGWEPYPLSLRIVNWIKWFSRFPERVQYHWRDSLGMQLDALNKQIEYHILGNHVFANAKALVFAGCYFDGQRANHWLMKGLKILRREIIEQFLSDGGHYELSPMYHATLLWDMCDLVHLADQSNNAVLLSQKVQWVAVIERGLDWLSCMVHPDEGIAFFNDAAFGIAPTLANLLIYASQLGIVLSKENNTDESVRLLKDSGYCVVNLQNNGKAILDVAKIGPDYQPGHAHADTLSFELSLHGQRVLVNSGTSQYGDDSQRLYQRSTKAHNTVCIDGKDSSVVWARFRVAQRAYPHDLVVRTTNKGIIFIGCAHNGYARLPGKNRHYREWHFSANNVIVRDVISGRYSDAEARFYLHPGVRLIKQEGHTVVCHMSCGQEVLINVDGASDLHIEQSHWYPSFGVSEKNICLIAAFKENALETQITW